MAFGGVSALAKGDVSLEIATSSWRMPAKRSLPVFVVHANIRSLRTRTSYMNKRGSGIGFMSSFRKAGILLNLLCIGFVSRAHAQDTDAQIANFYNGKTIFIVVGVGTGGGYDLTARVLSRYLGKYVPGRPNVVVQSLPGASSVLAANNVVAVAPQDGTVIAAVQRNIPVQFLFDMSRVQFDLRQLQWIGNTAKEPGVFVSARSAPQRTLKDLQTTEMIVGGGGPTTDSEINARALNSLLGTKLKIVSGYPGQNEMLLSMQRGELQGIANWSWSDIVTRNPDWISQKTVNVLLQFAAEPIPELSGTPFILDLARNDDDRAVLRLLMEAKEFGRPYFMSPKVPSARVTAIRKAFDATMKDPEFVAEATKTLGPLDPASGIKMQERLADVYATPAALIERAKAAVAAAN
jgi:tripartite-type tricarboxylate transporter receptor subunit TctC